MEDPASYSGGVSPTTDSVTTKVDDNEVGGGDINTFAIMKIYFGILVPVIVIGNSLTIVGYFKFRWLRSRANAMVLSLAVADVLCALSIAISTYYFMEGLLPILYSNPLLYYFIAFLLDLMVFASFTHNVILAIDRFVAVVFPFYYDQNMNGKAHFVLVISLWTFNAILIGIYSLCQYFVEVGLLNIDIGIFFFYMDLGLYLLTCMCMIIFIGKVTLTAHKLSKVIPGSAANNANELSSVRPLKTTTMFIKVVMVFVFIWLPFYIVVISSMAGLAIPHYDTIRFVFLLLGFSNWGLNVFIYGFSSKIFRLAYKRLIVPYISLTDEETSMMTVTA